MARRGYRSTAGGAGRKDPRLLDRLRCIEAEIPPGVVTSEVIGPRDLENAPLKVLFAPRQECHDRTLLSNSISLPRPKGVRRPPTSAEPNGDASHSRRAFWNGADPPRPGIFLRFSGDDRSIRGAGWSIVWSWNQWVSRVLALVWALQRR